jgi:hypothetical protein
MRERERGREEKKKKKKEGFYLSYFCPARARLMNIYIYIYRESVLRSDVIDDDVVVVLNVMVGVAVERDRGE